MALSTSFIRLSCSIIGCVFAFQVHAQNSVWNTAGAKKSATGKTDKAKHKLKDAKDHVQRWGLDTAYTHAFLAGGRLNSDGWSGGINFVKRKSYSTSSIWEIQFSEIKHEKQQKQKGKGYPELGNATPYVFGKINNLYTLHVGFAQEKLLLPAVIDDNLSVSFRYSAGLSLAMLKPYSLKLIYIDNSGTRDSMHVEEHTYNRADSAKFLNTNTILGASTWTRTLPSITYVPGVFAELAMTITPGKLKSFVQVISLGIHGAYYAQNLPILADNKSYPWTVNLFAGLGIGKRW